METEEMKCVCRHSHENTVFINPTKRWIFSVIFIVLALLFLKPFLFSQIFKRGCAYITHSMYDDAIRQYKKAIFLNKRNDDAWDWLGYAYKNKGDVKKAIETYEKAISINSNNKKAHFNLGMIYAIGKNFEKAASHFRYIVIIGKESENPASLDLISYHRSACEMLITCFERLGNDGEMKRAIDMTLKFYPDNKKVRDKLLKIRSI